MGDPIRGVHKPMAARMANIQQVQLVSSGKSLGGEGDSVYNTKSGNLDEVDRIIKSYDKNADGKVSREEVRNIVQDIRGLQKSNKMLRVVAAAFFCLAIASI